MTTSLILIYIASALVTVGFVAEHQKNNHNTLLELIFILLIVAATWPVWCLIYTGIAARRLTLKWTNPDGK